MWRGGEGEKKRIAPFQPNYFYETAQLDRVRDGVPVMEFCRVSVSPKRWLNYIFDLVSLVFSFIIRGDYNNR